MVFRAFCKKLARCSGAHPVSWLAALVVGTVCVASPSGAQVPPLDAEDNQHEPPPPPLTLSAVLKIALARNPELAEARERTRAERELAPSAGRRPDPELEYQLWAAPLDRPYALGDAEMHMLGIRQSFPAPGSLGAQSDAAAARADVTRQAERARQQQLVARVRRAYAQYYLADREYRAHVEHATLARQTVELTRAVYQGGRGSQQDILRAELALARLHSDLTRVEADRKAAGGLLNTLMARPAEAPLGPPGDLEDIAVTVRAEQALKRIEQRPEIAAGHDAVRASANDAEAARAAGRWPSFMVGVQYMYMPPMEQPHHYGVMLSMSVPWLSSRYDEQQRAAEARVAAERSALSSARLAASYELFEANERLKAARASLGIIERDLLPQAQRSFEAAQAAYRGGGGDSLGLFDALNTLLDVRLERERARASVATALANLDLAVGKPTFAVSPKEGK
jgi:outer membrane protein TolC